MRHAEEKYRQSKAEEKYNELKCLRHIKWDLVTRTEGMNHTMSLVIVVTTPLMCSAI